MKKSESEDSVLTHWFDNPPDLVHAFERFSRLPNCLLLESSRQTKTKTGRQLGRYSFLMADPVEVIQCNRIADVGNALKKIDSLLFQHSAANDESLPPMQGGIAGLFSYDLNRAFENVPSPRIDEFETPLISVGLYDVVLAFDHIDGRACFIANNWQHDATDRLEFFLDLISKGDTDSHATLPFTLAKPVEGQFSVEGFDELKSNFSPDAYFQAIKKSIDYIHAGDIFQVNIAQRLLMRQSSSSTELYKRLRKCNSSPFGGYYDFGDGQVVSASPERLVSVCGRQIETRPIKGTRLRTGRPMVDIAAGQKLEASEKDRAENTMIVDLMRNDLSRICTDDSVRVTQFCELEQYESVMHLVSAVEGTLRESRCVPGELLPAVFPGGSITGAPKVRAMEIIAQLEPSARGAYCGSLGYFSADGCVDLNILIRTITASKGWWQIPVGGGIVSDSKPESEYRETWTKAAGMLGAAIKPARDAAI